MLSEVLITSLQITGIWILFQDGMILNFLAYKDSISDIYGAKRTFPFFRIASKPISGCLICMASVWGCFFWIAEWKCEHNIAWFILSVLGVNTIINSVIDYFRNSPYFEKEPSITIDINKNPFEKRGK